MSISIRRLEAFVLVADNGSVAKAAQALGLSASAVTKSIRELEISLGHVVLFNRTPRKMALTEEGQMFLSRARIALGEIQRGLSDLNATRGGRPIVISIGLLPDCDLIVAKSVARFMSENENINIIIGGGRLKEHINSVLSGSMDILSGINIDLPTTSDLEIRPLYTDKLVFVARPGHPLANGSMIPLARLVAEKWLVPSNESPVWGLVKQQIQAQGLTLPREWIEVHHFSALLAILRTSDMITALPMMRIRDELAAGTFSTICTDAEDQRVTVSIAFRPWATLSSPVKRLISDIVNMAHQRTVQSASERKSPMRKVIQ